MTRPWELDGVSLLNAELMLEFSAEIRRLTGEASQLLHTYNTLHYANDVAYDLARLKGFADPADYPVNIMDMFGHTVQFMPVPDAGDFRIGGLTQEDKDALTTMVKQAEACAAKSVVSDLITPLTYAANRLAEYTGAKGQRFHDSVLTNIAEHIRPEITDTQCVENSSYIQHITTHGAEHVYA
jgi:hypothetical protein